jgi:hypothetical protein
MMETFQSRQKGHWAFDFPGSGDHVFCEFSVKNGGNRAR